jgi:lipoyl(octanoyl) transferase
MDTLYTQEFPTPLNLSLEWRVSPGLTPYDEAVAAMEERISAIHQGAAGELVWLLEHPPVYTAGTSAQETDLINPGEALIRRVGRGGEWTYHGPGQRVVYILLDLNHRGQDIRRYVTEVEGFAINTLARLGLVATRRDGQPGVWIHPDDTAAPPDKITAIGVRLTKWISWHGMAINVDPDLKAFEGIIPCGIHDGGMTKITAHKPEITMEDVDHALADSFAESFPF